MRLLSLVSILTLFTLSNDKVPNTFKSTGYYFCYSHEKKPKEESTLKYILHTDILKIERDVQVTKEKASDWDKFVNNRCKNTGGCTSDLMYYDTFDEADAMRNEMFKIYKNPEKYQIEKVEFK